MTQDPRDRFTKTPVVYQMPGTDQVTVRADVPFIGGDGNPLAMDVYGAADGASLGMPAVVIVHGYSDPGFEKMFGMRFKQIGAVTSWARLIAASGMVAVTYSNREPVADLDVVLDHLGKNAESLGIDPSRIGLWASSGHSPLAFWGLMTRPELTCAALLYPVSLDLDGGTGVAGMAQTFRFANPNAGRSVDDLPVRTPLFIARAGRDEMPGLNEALDRFVAKAIARNLPITLVNHPGGPHAFDLFDDSDVSREVVTSALAFLRFHLR